MRFPGAMGLCIRRPAGLIIAGAILTGSALQSLSAAQTSGKTTAPAGSATVGGRGAAIERDRVTPDGHPPLTRREDRIQLDTWSDPTLAIYDDPLTEIVEIKDLKTGRTVGPPRFSRSVASSPAYVCCCPSSTARRRTC